MNQEKNCDCQFKDDPNHKCECEQCRKDKEKKKKKLEPYVESDGFFDIHDYEK